MAFPFNPPLIAIFLRDNFSLLPFLLLSFLLSCHHSRNSQAYRASRKDVIDYTRRSRAEILRVVWI